jgi:ATP-dependent helicase/DNAse subunit B
VEQAEQPDLSRGATLTVHPTALTARGAVRESVRRAGAVLGSRAVTFPELTDVLARQLGVSERVLPAELAVLVLEAAVGDLPDLSEALRHRRRGLLRELQASIDELKAAGVAPDDLRAAAETLPAEAALRAGELARIYAAYERRLASIGALDRHGREWLVAERLAGCAGRGERPPVLAGVERIVFAEIYDFSVLQFLIATALVRLVGDAELVAFAHPENVDATRFLDRTWNRFVASEAVAEQSLPSFVVRGGRQGSLAAALRGVFATPRVPPGTGDDSIRVLAAPHRYAEVEAVMRNVRRRLEAGADPERLALIARDLGGRYAELIDDVARRFGVPVYFRKGEALLASGAVREAVGLLRAALEDCPRERLAGVVRSDYFRYRRSRAADLLAAVGYVSEAASPLERCLARHAAAETHDDPARAERARRAVERHRPALEAARAAIAGLAGRRRLPGHVAAWRKALAALGHRPVARELASPEAAARDARSWERFDQLLDSMAGVSRALGSGPIELDEFLGLVLAVAQMEGAAEPSAATGVRALSVLDARGLDFDVVYLLGLDDGTFPLPHRESAVLPDALKRLLGPALSAAVRRRAGAGADGIVPGVLLRTAREASLEDPFLFFLALSMPERQLVLAYPETDERGNPTVPSPFIDEVAACLSEPLPIVRVGRYGLAVPPGDCCEPAELVARAAADRWRPETSGGDWLTPVLRERLDGGAARLDDVDRRARIESARSRYFLTPLENPARGAAASAFVGRVPAGGTLAARIDAMRWSPTRIDQLAACGFKLFAARILGLREPDDPGADVDPRQRGLLLHRAFELLLRELPDLPADPPAARREARAALERLRRTVALVVSPRERVLVDLEWDRVLAAADLMIDLEIEARRDAAEKGLVIDRQLEWRFALTLAADAAGAPIAIEGKADRVDRWRRGDTIERVRVVDYKTTRDPAELARGLDPAPDTPRTSFQVPLYVIAAAGESTRDPGPALEGGYFAPLAARSKRSKLRDFDRAGLQAVEAEVRALVGTVRAGRFDVAPRLCDEWCAFRTVCRYLPPPVEEDVG